MLQRESFMNYRIWQSTAPPTLVLHTHRVVHPLWALLAVIYFPAMWKEGSLWQEFLLCCRLPVGCKLFSTRRCVWFLCNQSLSFRGCSHMVRVRLQGISVCFKAVWGRVFLNQFGYLTVGSSLFMSVLCCTYTVCPAFQLIHPFFVFR